MPISNFVPLLVACVLFALPALAAFHDGVDRVLTRLALGVFEDYVDEFRDEHPDRQAALRASHVRTSYREYGSKTLLFAAVLAVVGSVLGMYVIWGLLILLSIDPETMRERLPGALSFLANLGGVPSLTLVDLFLLMLLSCLTLGVLAGGGTYWLRWWHPSYVADNHARRIDAALPGTVAFVYALSRSGMAFPKVIRVVAAHDETYDDADEFAVAVRNMDAFGMDVVTALQTMGRRTPSHGFREFTENLVSVLRSGHSLSEFLERQYRDFQDEAESQQESMLELLGTLAEAYVTVLVAGPLFLITILVVIGFTVGDTLDPLRVLIYVILPFGNLAFIVYLSMVTDSIDPGSGRESVADPGTPSSVEIGSASRTDGGVRRAHPNVQRLRIYRRLRELRRRLGNPIRTVVDRPVRLLSVTVPLAAGAVLWHLPNAVEGGGFDAAAVEDPIVLSILFVVATFAAVYEFHRRRIEAVEAAIPGLLDRLASVNEAGMPLVSAVDHVRGSDLGALDGELDRAWADLQWGADLGSALRRFQMRVRTRSTARIVTLMTEAMNASGDLATVLRIAARQAAADRRLERERRRAMLEYMVVYVSFLVFLFIIGVLSAYLLPNLPTEGIDTSTAATGGSAVDGLGGLGEIEAAAYTTLFYHAALVQGLLSGFIAGQLSTDDVRAGAKHASVMVGVAYLLFTFVL